MLIIRGTNIYPGQIESVLMKYPEVGSNWRMIINTEKQVDQLTVEVESKSSLSQMESMDLEENLRKDIKSVLVFNPKILILQPKSIIQEGLKAKRVIDNRKKE